MEEARLETYLEEFRLKKLRMEQHEAEEHAQGLAPDVHYLVFSVGGEELGVPMSHVRMTMRLPVCTPLPFVPAFHKGIVSLRGRIVSVIDLRLKRAVEPGEVHDTPETALVVVSAVAAGDPRETAQTPCIGFAVDSVNRVLSVKSEQELQPVARLVLGDFLSEAIA